MARAENLAIMFVDMAGFAERTARQSRDQNKTMLRDFNRLLVPLIARFGGRRVKSIGDALLVTFRSPTDSVRCGMAMHDAVADYNRGHPDEALRIRVALNAGEVRIEKDDVFGEAVNIAARVEELTPPGEIYLTGVVYLSMNKAEVLVEHVGEQLLKGIPELVRLFRVPAHRIARLKSASNPLDAVPGELPFGGMHLLPADSHALTRAADALRRAPYVDWDAKLRAIPLRTALLAATATLVAAVLAGGAYWALSLKPADSAAVLAPPPVAINAEARDALAAAHLAYFERRRRDAAAAYAKVLEMDPRLQHDSGLAANLVGTLGWAGDLPMETIRQHPSPEIIYELGRRTSLPGRIGAQRAAALLAELGQQARTDQYSLAVTELKEAPTCEERLAAVRRIRSLRDVRALPVLRESIRRGFGTFFRDDRNACLRVEAQKTVTELERLSPPRPSS